MPCSCHCSIYPLICFLCWIQCNIVGYKWDTSWVSDLYTTCFIPVFMRDSEDLVGCTL